MNKWATSKGFTIVELLIVVVVIAILAAITIVAYNGISNRAKASGVQSSVSQAAKKVAAYLVTNSDTLPPDLATVGIANSGSTIYSYFYDTTPKPNIYCVSAIQDAVSYAASGASGAVVDGRCTSNRILNPSFETNTTSWSAAGPATSTLTRTVAEKYSGNASLQVVSNGVGGPNQGAFTSARASVTPSIVYTASVWIKGEVGKTLRIELGELDAASALIGTRTISSNIVGDGTWQRHTVNRTMSATAASADIVVRNVAAVAHTFYIDGAMISEGIDQLNFGDGNSAGWAWSGAANNTTSLGPVTLAP